MGGLIGSMIYHSIYILVDSHEQYVLVTVLPLYNILLEIGYTYDMLIY